MLRTFRVFAEHLDRMAEHQRGLFRREVQDRMVGSGASRAEILEASARMQEQLVELSYRASHLLHRRFLDRHAFENTAEQMARVCDAAHAGSVLATSEVAALTADRPWVDVGEVELKGVPHPVALVELTAPASGDGSSV